MKKPLTISGFWAYNIHVHEKSKKYVDSICRTAV